MAQHSKQIPAEDKDFFAEAQAFVARAEGGISKHPADRGGVTAYGASLAFVRGIASSPAGRDFLHSLGIAAPDNGKIGPEVILALTPEQVAGLFRREFWAKAGLDQLCSAGLGLAPALVIYDTAVNCGLRAAVRLAQRGYNSLPATARRLQPALVVDGSLGPRTRAALLASEQPALARAILAARRQYYRDIVAARPSQAVFLRGWLARCQNLEARLGL